MINIDFIMDFLTPIRTNVTLTPTQCLVKVLICEYVQVFIIISIIAVELAEAPMLTPIKPLFGPVLLTVVYYISIWPAYNGNVYYS